MRYTHNIKTIRKRKHVVKISVIFTILLVALILILGFTTLDAKQFFLGFLESFWRVIVAYLVAISIAIFTTIIITSTTTLESIFIPILDALQSFPSFALFPLLIVWFGRNSIDVIIILVLEMVWPILFTLLSAQKQIKTDLMEASKIFGAGGINYFLYVLLPLLFPAIVTGSIVAWGEAWETIIAAEIIVNVTGVGNYLSTAGNNNQTGVLVIGILLLLLILFIINKYIWLSLLNMSTKYQQE
ncbi:MAG TPA: ABC transporter permease subunit [Patescibacteria group bacterium]|nr:ABC transporter permease subunit [Patescibacteria group bacterium]